MADAPSALDLVNKYLADAKGNEYHALVNAASARIANEQDQTLRDAEHALFSRLLLRLFGPAAVGMTPLYSGAKAVAQSGLPGSGALNALSTRAGLPLASPTTSPPSLGEMWAGLSPIADPRQLAGMDSLLSAMRPQAAQAQQRFIPVQGSQP